MDITLSEPEAVPVSAVVFDAAIYPRDKHNTGTVGQYVEALRAGSTFPPIIVDADGLRILDGKHRWLAHQEAAAETILVQKATVAGLPEVRGEVEDATEKTAKLVVAYLRTCAAALNCDHGDRIPQAERQAVAHQLAALQVASDLKPDVSALAIDLRVSQRTMYEWLKDILQAQQVQENAKIAWLDLLAWTQREVGEGVGLDYTVANRRLLRFCKTGESAKSQQAEAEDPEGEKAGPDPYQMVRAGLNRGLSVEAIADKETLPVNLVQAIALQGKDDAERMAALKINVQPYDVWSFSSCHPMMGSKWPGRIPGELVCHLLYFFTQPGDLVVDPMVGSGTTIDACAYMGRRVYGCDANPAEGRFDVIEHNIAKDGWHPRTKDAKLIFWDPPYFAKKDDEYCDESISRLDREAYIDFFSDALAQAHSTVKPGATIALLMSDWDDQDNADKGIFIWDYADILRKTGWTLTRQIQVPLSTQQVHPDIVNKFRASRKLARLERYVLVGRA